MPIVRVVFQARVPHAAIHESGTAHRSFYCFSVIGFSCPAPIYESGMRRIRPHTGCLFLLRVRRAGQRTLNPEPIPLFALRIR